MKAFITQRKCDKLQDGQFYDAIASRIPVRL